MELEAIYAPIQNDLAEIEDRLKAVSDPEQIGDFPHLSELLEYSLRSNGKRIRPVLTLLAGRFYDYDNDNLLSMATAVEIMHTATLVHDDAIDNAGTRRGRQTVNKKWSDEKAVLLGDYLFAEAGALTASTDNLRAIKLFAQTLKTISSGEINQADNAFNLHQNRPQYIKRVAQKTAALFRMATESGAAMSQAPEEAIQVLIDYAYNVGIAFQIVDDILDFTGTEEELGKPAGSDLAQGTLTLPAMLLLEYNPRNNPVEKFFNNRDRPDYIKQAIDEIRDSSILGECYQLAEEYCATACRDLTQLPAGDSRESLKELAGFVTSRKK
ncbi:MAG: polyprenyl synthetase family protein [Dehalococcoidales bacterium]